jgi:HSP20 family protein
MSSGQRGITIRPRPNQTTQEKFTMAQLPRISRSIFDDFFNTPASLGYFVRPLHGEGLPESFKVDIKETDKAYLLHAEMPGVRKEDLHISVDNGAVTISAEIKQHDQQQQNERVVRSERYFGSLSRSFQLPQEVDASACEARYENGIVELTLPKRSAPSSRRIEIR